MTTGDRLAGIQSARSAWPGAMRQLMPHLQNHKAALYVYQATRKNMDNQQRLQKAKDTRTDQEFQRQYEAGHYNEDLVFQAMKCHKYKLNIGNYIGDGGHYEPDCFMLLQGSWVPVEIKTTKYNITTADFKAHQINTLAKIGGVILFATPYRMTIERAIEIQIKCPLLSAEQSKVNHEAFRCTLTNWAKWDNILPFK